MTKQREKQNITLWLSLGCGLALRLVLALVTEGYPYDMSCFVAWGDKLAAEGPAAFYSEGYFADYPPGYLWVLGLVGAIRAALHIAYESKWTYFLLALVPSLCDCAGAALVYTTARRGRVGEHMALVLAAFTAFNPLLLFDTGVWKQIDGAFALPLLLCFLLLEQRRCLPAAVWFGVALAIKPQALLFGPVLAACYLAAVALEEDKPRAFGRCFGGAALALLPPLAAGLPFFGIAQSAPQAGRKVHRYDVRLPLRHHQRLQLDGGAGRQLEGPGRDGTAGHHLAAAGVVQYPAGHGGAGLLCGAQRPGRQLLAAAAGCVLWHRCVHAGPLYA